MTVPPIISKAFSFIGSYRNMDLESRIASKVDSIIAHDQTKQWATFFRDEDAELWGSEAFKEIVKEVMDEHEHEYIYGTDYDKPVRTCKKAIELYCGYYHEKVNDLLRFNYHSEDFQLDKIIGHLDARLKKSHTPENIMVVRWVEEATFAKAFPNLGVGVKITDKGYLSTSLNIRYVNGYDYEPKRNFEKEILLLIKIPKGSSCMYVGNFGNRSHEQEVLLPSNTTLLVEEIHRVFLKRKVMVCSVCQN